MLRAPACGALVLVLAVFVVASDVSPARAADLHQEVGRPFQRLIEDVAVRHRIDPGLLAALVDVESGRNPAATSRAGAVGLAQLMPATARRFGVRDRTDPASNLEGGARYLSWLLKRYDGNVPLALAAYNAGEGNVDRYAGIPPFPETRGYVKRVLALARLDDAGERAPAQSARKTPRVRLVQGTDGSIELTNAFN